MVSPTQSSLRRVLVLRPNHRLGNNVLLTPLLSELARRLPEAQVEVLTGGGASRALFAGFPNVTAVHAFPAWSYSRPLEVLQVLAQVRARQYDLAIDALPDSRSARLLIGLVNARHKLGYGWGRAWRDAPLTQAVDAGSAPAHYGQAPVQLLRLALSQALTEPMPTLDLRLNEAEKSLGQRLLDQALGSDARVLRVGLYGVATGAKQYSPRWWLRFRQALQQQLAAVPHQLIEFLPHDGKSTFAAQVPTLLSVKLRELGSALAALDAFVTADCGVMHLASAAGTQTLGLFKVTDAERYGPYGHGSGSIAATDGDPEAAARTVAEKLRERLTAH